MPMNKQRNTLNFKGENIYVGIDVHLESWTVAILTDEIELKAFHLSPPSVESMVEYLHRNYPGGNYYSTYEAGFCGVWIHKELESRGVKNIVVNPSDVPTTDKERDRKRDSVDAMKLARSLRKGELCGIYIHSEKSLHDRALLRIRQNGVKDMTRIKNQIKGALHYSGIKIPQELKDCSKYWSGRFVKWLEEEVLLGGGVGQDSFSVLLETFNQRRSQMVKVLRKIRELSRTEAYSQNMEYIQSVPGIGLKTGMHLLVNIEDINRFANRDNFASFMGIVPSCHDSGDKESSGKITNRAPKELRSLLIESSWMAVRKDPALTMKFLQLRKRMDKNKAIIRIARVLCNRIYYVLKNKQIYVNAVV